MTTLYRFQKPINNGNTQVNGSLIEFTYFCLHYSPCSCLSVLFIQCKMQTLKIKLTVNFVSWFGKEPNNLVSQSKLFDIIVRHSVEISENDVMAYLTLKLLSPYYLTTMHEQWLWASLTLGGINNSSSALTLKTALHAVGSGTTLKVILKFAF